MDDCLIKETKNLKNEKLTSMIYCSLLWITPIVFISLLSNMINEIVQIEQFLYIGGILSYLISGLSYIGIGIVTCMLIKNYPKNGSLAILGGTLFGVIYSLFGLLLGSYIIYIPYLYGWFVGGELGFGYFLFGVYCLLLYRGIRTRAGDKNEEN